MFHAGNGSIEDVDSVSLTLQQPPRYKQLSISDYTPTDSSQMQSFSASPCGGLFIFSELAKMLGHMEN